MILLVEQRVSLYRNQNVLLINRTILNKEDMTESLDSSGEYKLVGSHS